ncbi:hypothetical protein AB0O76_27395 [Streptomyces sp. NPDC086554]|uniref:hypothetical protein n=1 Tax=Streptomyces sp. NPDC086554 TaxID=3154864 RepID=UPI00343C5BE9
MDSPGALCPVGQSRFWSDPYAETWGGGVATDSLSVVLSDGIVHSWFPGPAVTRAANGELNDDETHLLDDVSSGELHAGAEPPGFAELKAADRARYRLGLSHVLDV